MLIVVDNFSECVEKHAFHTYDEFIKLHGGMWAVLECKWIPDIYIYIYIYNSRFCTFLDLHFMSQSVLLVFFLSFSESI